MRTPAAIQAALAAAALAGCIRTTHEIKPVHITMDINLKIDNELAASAADARKRESWRERKPKIDALKASGAIGEGADGLLAPVLGATGFDSEAFALVQAVNESRKERFANIAARQKSTPEAVAKRSAARAAEDAAAGVFIQDAQGGWAKK